MKKLRLTGKALTIVIGAVGLSAIVSSCKKLRSCACTTTYTYTGGASYTYTQTQSAVVKKCSDLDATSSNTYNSISKSCAKL